jgi:hypothetical protein
VLFLQFFFSLMPELVIPSIRPVIALPDFVGALADLVFGGFSHGAPLALNLNEHGPPGGFKGFQKNEPCRPSFRAWPNDQFDDLKVVPAGREALLRRDQRPDVAARMRAAANWSSADDLISFVDQAC